MASTSVSGNPCGTNTVTWNSSNRTYGGMPAPFCLASDLLPCGRRLLCPLRLAQDCILALTAPPGVTPHLTELRHPARRELEPLCRCLGLVAQRQEMSEVPVTLAKSPQEVGPIDAKGGGVGRWGDRVVLEPLLEGV